MKELEKERQEKLEKKIDKVLNDLHKRVTDDAVDIINLVKGAHPEEVAGKVAQKLGDSTAEQMKIIAGLYGGMPLMMPTSSGPGCTYNCHLVPHQGEGRSGKAGKSAA